MSYQRNRTNNRPNILYFGYLLTSNLSNLLTGCYALLAGNDPLSHRFQGCSLAAMYGGCAEFFQPPVGPKASLRLQTCEYNVYIQPIGTLRFNEEFSTPLQIQLPVYFYYQLPLHKIYGCLAFHLLSALDYVLKYQALAKSLLYSEANRQMTKAGLFIFHCSQEKDATLQRATVGRQIGQVGATLRHGNYLAVFFKKGNKSFISAGSRAQGSPQLLDTCSQDVKHLEQESSKGEGGCGQGSTMVEP